MERSLKVESIDRDYFLGRDLLGFKTGRGAYGGHVLGQALNAAVKTVDNPKFIIRSAHCYYLRPVKINTDVVYHVTRLKDGRSVATREVTATQAEKNVFSCLTSFSMEDTEEVGLYHTDQQMPQVDPPPSEPAVVDEVMSKSHLELTLFPMRMSRATLKESKDLPQTGIYTWMQSRDSLPPDAQNIHRIALAYASDFGMPWPIFTKYSYEGFETTSLDHAIWFHENVNFNQWHLFVQVCVQSCHGLPLNSCRIYDQAGTLVATVMQQSLARAKL